MTTTHPTRNVNTPRRAKVATLGLLAAVLGVAFLTTREPPPPALGATVHPPGWRVGFAPPVGWLTEGESLASPDGRMRTYAPADDRRRVSLAKLPVEPDESVESVCREMLNAANVLAMMGSPRDVHISEQSLGAWPGVLLEWTPEFMGQTLGDHVFMLGAIAPSSELGGQHYAYVFQFHSPAPVTEKDRRLWTLLVESIVTQEGPP